ncbi:MAG: O-antigen ligase family protein [Bacteroidia bacterium]|nr:O-antigen ligase family protein [Bacteroidia bacterium]
MFQKIRSTRILFHSGLLMLVTGMPLSLFLTSLSQFFLAGSFLLEGRPKEKFNRFFHSPSALLFSGIWLLHSIGLFWTSDIQEGIKDIRIKLPMLILPLILAGSKPLEEKWFRIILKMFIFSVFAGTIVSISVLAGITGKEIHDMREVFIFNISHIRFALLTCVAIYGIFWLIKHPLTVRNFSNTVLPAALAVWLIAFCIITELVTGIFILCLTGVITATYYIFTHSKSRGRWIFGAGMLLIAIGLGVSIKQFISEYSTHSKIEINTQLTTALGNPYYNNLDQPLYENGYPVWVYVCEPELKDAWNKRSTIPYDSLDKTRQLVRYTLVRFLASKGLKKDAEGVNSLTDDEIRAIENGTPDVTYLSTFGMYKRFLEIIWEIDQYRKGRNPSGHSVVQRFEFWKAAGNIIKAHPLYGVGTGDMPQAYKQEYDRTNSPLDANHRLRAHNQFLAIAVAFGIPGLLYFIFALLFLPLYRKRYQNLLALSFWLTAIFSMLTEDTLETQAGATFVAMFTSFFFWSMPEGKNKM